VWLPKGTTLKGIMLIFSWVINNKFYSTSRITFRHTVYALCSSALICTWWVFVGKQTVLTDGFRGITQTLYENTVLVL
jgi:hypothetical protein